MKDVRVFDNFLPDPEAYRAAALTGEYKSYEFPEATFHNISLPTPLAVPERLTQMFPRAQPILSFFRKSPQGQVEPHFIHTDVDMGEWTAILYLNPAPPPGDGTAFWRHRETGAIESAIAHERSVEGRTPALWDMRRLVAARFNRLLLFPATFFHSRAIAENWGEGDAARLIQVVFGRGSL
jgi:hypothetical protein